ncbi:ABC transporter substrate-binding protein [Fulvivirga sp. 29W222]|uniref:ABC transporter substrate-binding protein n=1 Tax=Fulvivirga marina TaxID=2494733 RepID=A0A937KB23_9BACT|nr:ABC transporter substrate-binding protein [Fulvivirga marina]MBL6445324.1 ABC transporter substrate-binding protein [Fulvivirga marina]
MKQLRILVVVCLSIGTFQAYSQVNYQQQYLHAKELFGDEKYSLAMEAFKPLLSREASNPFPAYASFYYAVAAYRDGYPPLAKNMFLQIKSYFPKWSKMPEVNFWLGKIYFESGDYNQGLNVLAEIKDKNFQENIFNLKHHVLSGVKDIELLEELYRNHPKERAIGEVLATVVAKQPLVNQDQELLDELISKFNLDRKALDLIKVDKSVFKDSYKVAVLFPFLMDRLEPTVRKKVNQLILDMYQGMQLAMDTLEAQGIKVELYAYDTQRDSVATARILAKEEMKSMDLIVGPFFSEPRALVQDFSFKNKINMINPLSMDSDVIGVNPYSFLLHPTNETVGRKMAEYVAKKARRKTGVIFYGEDSRDSTLAYSFKRRIEKEGFNIIINKEIRKHETREILDILVTSGKIKDAASDDAKGNYRLAQDSIGYIFVASNNDLISTKVISAVETRGDSIMVIGSADWLDLPVINYEVYYRLGAVLYAPMYIQKESDEYEIFRDQYVKKHKVPATQYAEMGYDLMNLVGHSLNKYGKYFQLGWDEESYLKGYLTIGYSYEKSQDNKLVPILEFGDEGLEVVYELEEDKNEDRKK